MIWIDTAEALVSLPFGEDATALATLEKHGRRDPIFVLRVRGTVLEAERSCSSLSSGSMTFTTPQ